MHTASPRQGSFRKRIYRDRHLILMSIPAVAFYLIFSYIPMTGIVIAFKNFQPGLGLYTGEWVGMKWFNRFFSSVYFERLLRNTFLLSFYSLLFGFPVPILFALCISEVRNIRVKRAIQTISYLPYFFSTVIVVGMVRNFLSLNDGIVNDIIEMLGGERINFFMRADWFRTIYVCTSIWQHFGFSSIIYIAAIIGISPELYESASLDGINKFQEVWYITLPMIKPTVLILFLLEIGNLMSVGYERVYLMYNPSTYETADVISTYVYRQGIEMTKYSFSAAIGLFNSVMNFAFVFTANCITKKMTNSSLW
ncbi:MAG: ABC transporter permease subunit [Eubacteriales bacterium]|nr:ABC transporter permease subunit [Eubacteriales bacterium]